MLANKFVSYQVLFQIFFYDRERDRMKGFEAFPERGKGKLELLTNQMNEEKEILRKMKEKKCGAQT